MVSYSLLYLCRVCYFKNTAHTKKHPGRHRNTHTQSRKKLYSFLHRFSRSRVSFLHAQLQHKYNEWHVRFIQKKSMSHLSFVLKSFNSPDIHPLPSQLGFLWVYYSYRKNILLFHIWNSRQLEPIPIKIKTCPWLSKNFVNTHDQYQAFTIRYVRCFIHNKW